MNIKKEIGEKIKRCRKKCGYTQEKLAETIDISSRNLSNIELGLSYPKPETLEKIMQILDMSTQELFATEHLKSDAELLSEINSYINTAQSDRLLLEKVYRVLKAVVE